MIDWNIVVDSAVAAFRQHTPWLADKAGAAMVSQVIKEAWEQVRKRIGSSAASQSVQATESDPADEENWIAIQRELRNLVQQDAVLAGLLCQLLESQPPTQSIQGNQNTQAGISNSAGAVIRIG